MELPRSITIKRSAGMFHALVGTKMAEKTKKITKIFIQFTVLTRRNLRSELNEMSETLKKLRSDCSATDEKGRA